MAISDEQVEEIKAKVDIADLVSSYGFELKQSGSDLWCCCPFHNEKTPSFKVDSSKGYYHCFGCGESGDIFTFVQKQDGLSFIEAANRLAERAGVELKATVSKSTKARRKIYELMSALSQDFNRMLKSGKGEGIELARKYLQGRKLDDNTVDKFCIGYAPSDVDKILLWAKKRGYTEQDLSDAGVIKLSIGDNRKPYFYFANRIVFTIKDKNGQAVAFSGRQLVEDKKSGKYVNSPETLIFKKSRTFFAFDEARKNIVKAPNREAIVCEGQIDCIRLHTSGYNTAVAPLGTAFTEEHATLLHRVADTALLCFDDDGAGHNATIKAARLLLAEGMPIRVISLPDGDDPDSYILKHGSDAFGELIKSKAESIVQFQMRSEQQKETDKNDPNLMVRVVKSVLETIARCSDKVLRTVLLKELASASGMEYETLAENISKDVKVIEEDTAVAKEEIINPTKEQDIDTEDFLPTISEDALIGFLVTVSLSQEIKDCVTQLIPIDILKAKMSKILMEAILKGIEDGIDYVQIAVESLSDEEYKHFLAIVTIGDTTNMVELQDKNKVLYFARQIWFEYLTRSLLDNTITEEKRNTLIRIIKNLHTASIRGVVQLITEVSREWFKKAA